MILDNIYHMVEEACNEVAFRRDECEKLFSLQMGLKNNALIVELGIGYGRTTTIMAEIAKHKNQTHIAIDNFCQDDGQRYKKHQQDRFNKYNWNKSKLLESDTVDAVKKTGKKKVDLLLVDGDHTAEGVTRDIKAWLPRVKKGSYILFHDYGRDSLPGPHAAVQPFLEDKKLEYIETIYTLGVFKKS